VLAVQRETVALEYHRDVRLNSDCRQVTQLTSGGPAARRCSIKILHPDDELRVGPQGQFGNKGGPQVAKVKISRRGRCETTNFLNHDATVGDL